MTSRVITGDIMEHQLHAEVIPHDLLKIINKMPDNPEYEKLLASSFAYEFGLIDDPEAYSEMMKKLHLIWEEQEKQENHRKGNPIMYARINKAPDKTDLYLSTEMFLRVLEKLPLNLWINGGGPYQSPISVVSHVQEIYICPFERNGIVSAMMPNFDDITFRELRRHNSGEQEMELFYHPTKYGIKDYEVTTLDLESGKRIKSKEDNGLVLRVFPQFNPEMMGMIQSEQKTTLQ